MSGYIGKRRRIVEIIGEPVNIREGRWGRKLILTCGHTVIGCLGNSPNHRRSRPPAAAYCMKCDPGDP